MVTVGVRWQGGRVWTRNSFVSGVLHFRGRCLGSRAQGVSPAGLRKGFPIHQPSNPQRQIAQHQNISGYEPLTGPGKKTARARAFSMELFDRSLLLALFESSWSLINWCSITFKVGPS